RGTSTQDNTPRGTGKPVSVAADPPHPLGHHRHDLRQGVPRGQAVAQRGHRNALGGQIHGHEGGLATTELLPVTTVEEDQQRGPACLRREEVEDLVGFVAVTDLDEPLDLPPRLGAAPGVLVEVALDVVDTRTRRILEVQLTLVVRPENRRGHGTDHLARSTTLAVTGHRPHRRVSCAHRATPAKASVARDLTPAPDTAARPIDITPNPLPLRLDTLGRSSIRSSGGSRDLLEVSSSDCSGTFPFEDFREQRSGRGSS